MKQIPFISALAWLATVAIGAAWQLATRLGVTTTLTPLDLALLRYAVPVLVLFPLLVRHGVLPQVCSVRITALMVVGGGLPFGLLGMAGAQFAPVVHMAALLPGSMPVFVALLSLLAGGERFSAPRLAGLAVVVCGVALVVASAFSVPAGRAVLVGDAMFLAAGMLWAFYTVAYRESGVAPWHAAAVICFWSCLLVTPLWFASDSTRLSTAPMSDVLLQILAQGVLAGLLGLAVYGVAIRHLGASRAAISGAVVPVAAALGAAVLLGEAVAPSTGGGIALVAFGLMIFLFPR